MNQNNYVKVHCYSIKPGASLIWKIQGWFFKVFLLTGFKSQRGPGWTFIGVNVVTVRRYSSFYFLPESIFR